MCKLTQFTHNAIRLCVLLLVQVWDNQFRTPSLMVYLTNALLFLVHSLQPLMCRHRFLRSIVAMWLSLMMKMKCDFGSYFFLCLELVHVLEGLSPGRFNQWAYRPGRTFDWTITNASHRNVEKNTRLRIRGCSSLCRLQKGHWQCFSFYLVYETQDIKILSALTDLYFDVILLSLSYGLKLVLWGSCCNSEILQSLERLHYRAARLILNLPNDMESCQVLKQAQWCNLYSYFKPVFFICIHKAYHE